jgi:hypothetical protein
MDINHIYISQETSFGYKLVKVNKLFELDKFNIVPASPDEIYLERNAQYKQINLIDIGKYNFANSKIKEVILNNGILNIKTLSKILVQIYKLIGNSTKIIKNSKLIITKIENGETKIKGREYINSLNISYPKPEANLCVYEIFSQSELNNITISIKFELTNKEMIKIKL